MQVIILDTETTGLLKPTATDIEQQPYIIDIFCLKIDYHEADGFYIIDEFESLIKPPVPISEEITKITGITDALVSDSPAFGDIASEVAEFFLGTERMVAHNLSFDRGMLVNELFRCDRVLKFPWPMDHLCTVEKTMFIEQRRMSLQNLHKHLLGFGFDNAHRAKTDVLALFNCYKELAKRNVV